VHAFAIADLFEYIEDVYHRERRHLTLGNVTPIRALQRYIKPQHERNLAALCMPLERQMTRGSTFRFLF
jgi:hypothetical protein